EKGLVVLEAPQGRHDGVERLPRACRLAGASIDHESVGSLGHLGIEIVHEHPEGGFLGPAFARALGTARGSHRSGPDAGRLREGRGHSRVLPAAAPWRHGRSNGSPAASSPARGPPAAIHSASASRSGAGGRSGPRAGTRSRTARNKAAVPTPGASG